MYLGSDDGHDVLPCCLRLVQEVQDLVHGGVLINAIGKGERGGRERWEGEREGREEERGGREKGWGEKGMEKDEC